MVQVKRVCLFGRACLVVHAGALCKHPVPRAIRGGSASVPTSPPSAVLLPTSTHLCPCPVPPPQPPRDCRQAGHAAWHGGAHEPRAARGHPHGLHVREVRGAGHVRHGRRTVRAADKVPRCATAPGPTALPGRGLRLSDGEGRDGGWLAVLRCLPTWLPAALVAAQVHGGCRRVSLRGPRTSNPSTRLTVAAVGPNSARQGRSMYNSHLRCDF